MKNEIFAEPIIMGVLNVTPDSFSDGGMYVHLETAVERGLEMREQGADIIDVGGESSRPGSSRVEVDEEIRRVIPVIEQLASHDIFVSVDTTKPEVAKRALDAGARMINDISMLRADLSLATLAAAYDAYLVIMHSKKTPKDMQQHTSYDNVVTEVANELKKAAERAMAQGVQPNKIWIDPGIGFAKTAVQNIELLAMLGALTQQPFPVLVGPSRKSFIGAFTDAPENDRIGGTAAAVALSIYHGAKAIRVHDIKVMRQAAIISYEAAKYVKANTE